MAYGDVSASLLAPSFRSHYCLCRRIRDNSGHKNKNAECK